MTEYSNSLTRIFPYNDRVNDCTSENIPTLAYFTQCLWTDLAHSSKQISNPQKISRPNKKFLILVPQKSTFQTKKLIFCLKKSFLYCPKKNTFLRFKKKFLYTFLKKISYACLKIISYNYSKKQNFRKKS